ncbi:HAD-like domain [Pseudocohnilembus persalinus]|uniref:Phosphomannomutase n=1 Tax=Pseudocohnilembus persalinus TaxID=266149 RepID=A0A0V0QYA6_PSEPJ|nr:HAD-like domain [Pseudocohnilembus persalinus]|eukprot:KRX07324.1 HAD-like domain [Pseudocohnilembus persalinus]
MSENKQKKQICLFDVDGTLTKPRNPIENDMIETLLKLQKKVEIGIISGSDKSKCEFQLTKEVINQMNWAFFENGLDAEKFGKLHERQSIKKYLGEEKIKKFINYCLIYIANLDIPIKRGTFIEFRNGLINVSPIGRNCSQEERDEFEKYDKENNIRSTFIAHLEKEFKDFDLQFSVGGQISFDVFPKGWDKTYCLRFLEEYDEIRFFGDKTYKGGNDYELYSHPRSVGVSVKDQKETIQKLNEIYEL